MMMGYREYARHRKVTLRAVQKAIESGRIVVNADKKIDAQIADKAWDANTDIGRIAVNVTQTPMQIDTSTSQVNNDDDDDELPADDSAGQYREHRTAREMYQMLKIKLEYEQLVGQMINVDDAKRIVYTSFRSLRDSILNVPARIKDQLAASSDAVTCEQMVLDELSAALAGVDITKLLIESSDDG